MLGANHNYFNTVWTPGSYIAGGVDDWSYIGGADAQCGPASAKRFDTTKQKAAYNAYAAAEKIIEAIEFYGNNFIQLRGLGFTCTLEKLVKLKLINARFGEVPFVLRYDQKQSTSKMVGSITTLGYVVMTVLYYWPWGGWRTAIRKKHNDWSISNDAP